MLHVAQILLHISKNTSVLQRVLLRLALLLSPAVTRSDALEESSSSDTTTAQPRTASGLEDPPPSTNLALHTATGSFIDPSHEKAFAAQLFRLAFPGHVLLMALALALSTWMAIVAPPGVWSELVAKMDAACATFALVARVILHRMHDLVRAQRLGSWTWTAVVVLICITDASSYIVPPSAAQHGLSAPSAVPEVGSRASSGRA